jgi:hypothetical protein
MHFTKFGTQVVAGMALVAVDVIYLIAEGTSRPQLRRAWQSWIITGAAYLGAVALATGALLLFISPPAALDVVLPLYLRGCYTFVTPEIRYPTWQGLVFFLHLELPGLIGLAALAAALGRCFQRPRAARPAPSQNADHFPYALLLPPLVYAFSLIVLFRQEFHYYHDVIFAVLGFPLILRLFGPATRAVALVLLLPCVMTVPVFWVRELTGTTHQKPQVMVSTPAGYTLTASPETADFYRRLETLLEQKVAVSPRAAERTIGIIDGRPGMHYFYNYQVAGRHSYYLFTYVRPWEEAAETKALLNASAIALAWPRLATVQAADRDATKRALAAVLPADLSETLASRLVNPVCAGVDPTSQKQVWVFSVADTP